MLLFLYFPYFLNLLETRSMCGCAEVRNYPLVLQPVLQREERASACMSLLLCPQEAFCSNSAPFAASCLGDHNNLSILWSYMETWVQAVREWRKDTQAHKHTHPHIHTQTGNSVDRNRTPYHSYYSIMTTRWSNHLHGCYFAGLTQTRKAFGLHWE